MSLDDNKAVAMRFFEALDTGDISILEALFTEDCVFHRADLLSRLGAWQEYVQ
jgi:ketosteroid isomerase-like protein